MVRHIYLIVFAVVVVFIGSAALPASAQTGRTFYIDYDNGSNSNNGTSKTTPWKTHPYMQTGVSCTGSGAAPAYAHLAGDRFIFKGGVTWPSSCFRLYVTAGGNPITPDYYGVDNTWYAGGSWARPIFDGQNNVPAGNTMVTVRAQWVTFDNLEVARMKINSGVGECADANFDLATSASGNITVENSYIHDWTITTLTSGSTTHGTGSICTNGSVGPINAIGNTITDQNTTAVVPFGACFRNLTNVENNDCEHTGEGEVGHFGNTDGNIFANINGAAVQAHDTTLHTNILEISKTTAGDGPIYNNLIHDNNAGVTIFDCNRASIYNNVMWNNSNYAIMLDSNCPGATPSTVANVYNNTVDCSNTNECFRVVYRSGTSVPSVLNLRNNHWIANGTPTCFDNTSAGCGNVSGGTQANNITMSKATATSDGYTSANAYQPMASSSATVNTGVSLSGDCSGPLVPLCADRLGNPRLSSWDAGAYEFGGQSPSSKPNPPTNLTARVQ